ncbi:hypothetical protein B5181_37580, partial [Streptomyces sp. 4F]
EGEGVVESEVGEAVGAVAEAEGGCGCSVPGRARVRGRLIARGLMGVRVHVMLTFLMAALFANIRPAGARAATS